MPTEDFGKFGEYVRQRGHEVGTRSGRVRRYGLNALGLSQNDEVALTKLDVLSGLDYIPVCISYRNLRKGYDILPALKSGGSLQRRMTYQRSIHPRFNRGLLECCYKVTPSTDAAFLEKVKPKIIKLKGWKEK